MSSLEKTRAVEDADPDVVGAVALFRKNYIRIIESTQGDSEENLRARLTGLVIARRLRNIFLEGQIGLERDASLSPDFNSAAAKHIALEQVRRLLGGVNFSTPMELAQALMDGKLSPDNWRSVVDQFLLITGLTQTELARKLRVAPASVTRVARGQRLTGRAFRAVAGLVLSQLASE